jgi:phthalate 4,5-cis-dihydrodiol dehydrogenase
MSGAAHRPPLRLGVIGLGRAFTLMLPAFMGDKRVQLVAAADPLPEARSQFQKDFGVPAYSDPVALFARNDVDAVYVASPHQLHEAHVVLAAKSGKHVLVEKPMATTLPACTRMIEACHSAKVVLVVGHSHSFNLPIRKTLEIIQSGRYGPVRMVHALNYTDFLYRPRRPEELDTALGGGVVFSQAAHQVDIVRLLCGGMVQQVHALVGNWDPERSTEGAYSALMQFEQGVFASLTYSGYAHFNSDQWMDGVGELGLKVSGSKHADSRAHLYQSLQLETETQIKAKRNYGAASWRAPDATVQAAHQHFGPIIISCDKADLRPVPSGVHVDSHDGYLFEALAPPTVVRQDVLDEFLAAVQSGVGMMHTGEWARASLASCLGILESAQRGRPVSPAHQVPVPPPA